jgi:hypothetical protein
MRIGQSSPLVRSNFDSGEIVLHCSSQAALEFDRLATRGTRSADMQIQCVALSLERWSGTCGFECQITYRRQ